MTPFSRRNALVGAALSAVGMGATWASPPAIAAEPDADVIAASNHFIQMEAEFKRRCYAGEPDYAPKSYDAFNTNRYNPALYALYGLSASTLAGFRARAAAVYAFYDPDPPTGESAMSPVLWDLICELAGKPYVDIDDDEASETASNGAAA